MNINDLIELYEAHASNAVQPQTKAMWDLAIRMAKQVDGYKDNGKSKAEPYCPDCEVKPKTKTVSSSTIKAVKV